MTENHGSSVQFGCGWSPADDWLNFDSSPTLQFERIPLIGRLYTRNATRFPTNVLYGDIVKGLPLPEQSVSRLFSSHVLEHLALNEAVLALRNSFKLMRPGGVFRIIVPDLKVRAERYLSESVDGSPEAAHEFMRTTLLGQESRPRGARGIILAALGGSDHRWMWDERSLTDALVTAGFCDVRRCSFGDSRDPLFAEVEDQDRFVDHGMRELALECRRPSL